MRLEFESDHVGFEPSRKRVREVSRELNEKFGTRLSPAQRRNMARNFLKKDPYYGRLKPLNPWEWDRAGRHEDRKYFEKDLLLG